MKNKILKILENHLKTYAEVGGIISKGIPQYELEYIVNEIIYNIYKDDDLFETLSENLKP